VPTDAVAVLASGGLDSAVLVGQLGAQGHEVTPIYVRFGLAWEEVEIDHLRRFLATLSPEVAPLVELAEPVVDLYGSHWSVTGNEVPDAQSADDAVYLPGRNLLLLAKASVWCALNGVGTIALGTLAANPFPDADSAFFDAFSALASRALTTTIHVITPYAGLEKHDVVEIGRAFALDQTFSCMDPVDGRHCGECNKCAERRGALFEHGVADSTVYATA
jgi:7-cyano-7-deazaguanine synthase